MEILRPHRRWNCSISIVNDELVFSDLDKKLVQSLIVFSAILTIPTTLFVDNCNIPYKSLKYQLTENELKGILELFDTNTCVYTASLWQGLRTTKKLTAKSNDWMAQSKAASHITWPKISPTGTSTCNYLPMQCKKASVYRYEDVQISPVSSAFRLSNVISGIWSLGWFDVGSATFLVLQ